LSDLATEISRHSGKLIPYKNLREGEYAEALKRNFGFPDEIAQVLAGMDVAVSKDALFDNGHQLSELIGRSTTPMPITVAEAIEGS
jgi:NAD(P)H dehydrogenase (quinone)